MPVYGKGSDIKIVLDQFRKKWDLRNCEHAPKVIEDDSFYMLEAFGNVFSKKGTFVMSFREYFLKIQLSIAYQ